MKKIREVMRLLLDRGASVRQIAAACNIGRSTAGEYAERARAAGLTWEGVSRLSEEELTAMLFPEKSVANTLSRPLPDWNEVRAQLAHKGMTLMLVWENYKKAHPGGYSYSRFTRFYSNWLKSTDLRMLQFHKAGEKMFVDWSGLKVKLTDPETGEIWQAPVFVSALGASQYTFAKAYKSEELKWWLAAHVEAFEFYGALPEIVVPDNLKTGVTKPCRYEPAINQAYAELAEFYEVAVLPARVRKPRDKAKVENAVQQVERRVLAHLIQRTFFTLEEVNEAINEKLRELNERVMKGPQSCRKDLFQAEELPAMRPLPDARYCYAEWKRVKVAPDYHVEVEGRLYSVPFSLSGKHVEVRVSSGTVEVFHAGKRMASHLRSISRRGFTTDPSHMPERHKKHAGWTSERMIRWAGTVGPNTSAFAEALLKGKLHPEHGFRMCMGVISLEKRFDKNRLEAACAKALSLGALSYQSVKSILEKNLDAAPSVQELPPLPSHDNVRGGSYYAQEALCAKSR
jgi:transposase